MRTVVGIILGLTLLGGWWLPPAWGSTYYVANNGSDSHPCTEAQPCATIAKGRSKLQSGDTLALRGGTYSESIRITVSDQLPNGSSWDHATTIAGFPGETVTLAGGSIEFSPQPWHGPRVLFQYMVFKNFRITNDGGVGAQGCGYNSDGSVDMACGPHFIRFEDIEVSGKGCHSSVGSGFGASDLQFIRITVHDGGCDRLDHGFYVLSPRMLIDRVEVYNYSGYGLQLYDSGCPSPDGGTTRNCGEGTVIRNSKFHDNHGDGAVNLNHASNVVFINNVVSHNDHGGLAGISYGRPTNTRVERNTFANNGGTALAIDAGAVHTMVTRNCFMNNVTNFDNRSDSTVFDHNMCATAGDHCAMVGTSGADLCASEAPVDGPRPSPPGSSGTPPPPPAPKNLRVLVQP